MTLLNLCLMREMMNWSTLSSSSPESGRHTSSSSASSRPDLWVTAATVAWNSPPILMLPWSASSVLVFSFSILGSVTGGYGLEGL